VKQLVLSWLTSVVCECLSEVRSAGVGRKTKTLKAVEDDEDAEMVPDESYMSSRDWLKRHGLIARRLGFYDVLAGVAFKHEDGVLDLRVAPPCDEDHVVDAVSCTVCVVETTP